MNFGGLKKFGCYKGSWENQIKCYEGSWEGLKKCYEGLCKRDLGRAGSAWVEL